jgi:pimeloyl-ACP methyl ester carboxylesterase
LKEDEKQASRQEKPRLVLIHGYGATGLMFYKCVDLLRKEFRLTTIDLLGMGGSGRPPYTLKTSRDTVSYFVHSIEAFLRNQDKINSAHNGSQ